MEELSEPIISFLNHSLKHSYYLLYYLHKLIDDENFCWREQVKQGKERDGQVIHDLEGPGSKLEYSVAIGLAGPKYEGEKFEESLKAHRQGQKHHHYNGTNIGEDIEHSYYWRTIRALDIILSIIYEKGYGNQQCSLEELLENPEQYIIGNGESIKQKIEDIRLIGSLLKKYQKPLLTDLTIYNYESYSPENYGLPEEIVERFKRVVREGLTKLKEEYRKEHSSASFG